MPVAGAGCGFFDRKLSFRLCPAGKHTIIELTPAKSRRSFPGFFFLLVDIPSCSVIIPTEISSPITLLGVKVWSKDFKPHFFKVEKWGFLF
jgi:hypothetical protein